MGIIGPHQGCISNPTVLPTYLLYNLGCAKILQKFDAVKYCLGKVHNLKHIPYFVSCTPCVHSSRRISFV